MFPVPLALPACLEPCAPSLVRGSHQSGIHMTDNFKADQAIRYWLTLAGNVADMADRLDTVDPDCLSGNLSDLRRAFSCAVPLFRANGGLSLAERPNLRQVMDSEDPTLLPSNIIKEGALEGAQQLWAIASLLRMGEPVRVPADITSGPRLEEHKAGKAVRPAKRIDL